MAFIHFSHKCAEMKIFFLKDFIKVVFYFQMKGFLFSILAAVGRKVVQEQTLLVSHLRIILISVCAPMTPIHQMLMVNVQEEQVSVYDDLGIVFILFDLQN